jgi:hypothetical protein
LSHRIAARCKITEKNHILSALEKLGWVFSTGAHGIKLGDTLELIQQKDGTWQITGDPYYDSTGLKKYYNNTSQLIADLQTYYNQSMAVDRLQGMGFYLEQEENNKDEIVLTFDNGM